MVRQAGKGRKDKKGPLFQDVYVCERFFFRNLDEASTAVCEQ